MLKELKFDESAQHIILASDNEHVLIDFGVQYQVFQLPTLKKKYQVNESFIRTSHSGKWLLSQQKGAKGNDTLKVRDIGSGREGSRLYLKPSVRKMQLSPNDKYLLIDYDTGEQSHSSMYKLAGGGQLLFHLPASGGKAWSSQFSPLGNYILTINGSAKVWNAATGAPIDSFGSSTGFVAATFSPDEKHIVTEDQNASISVWDAATFRALRVLRDSGSNLVSSKNLQISRDGTYVYAVNNTYEKASLWNLFTGQQIYDAEHDYVHTIQRGSRGFLSVNLNESPDGRFFAVTKYDRGKLFDTRTGRFHDLLALVKIPRSSRFCPNGLQIATIYADSTMDVRNLTSGAAPYTVAQKKIIDLAYNRAGTLMSVISADQTIKTYETTTGKLISEIAGANPFHSASFSHRGNKLITAEHNQVRIWQAETEIGRAHV